MSFYNTHTHTHNQKASSLISPFSCSIFCCTHFTSQSNHFWPSTHKHSFPLFFHFLLIFRLFHLCFVLSSWPQSLLKALNAHTYIKEEKTLNSTAPKRYALHISYLNFFSSVCTAAVFYSSPIWTINSEIAPLPWTKMPKMPCLIQCQSLVE